MTEKRKQTKAGAAELNEEELGEVQGGLVAHELTHLKGKKAPKTAAGGDLGGGRPDSFQDGDDLF